ncbi:MAG: RluA family pseudouridine synthase [Deltaproteobacteria bacterium]|nr:RluA family pseudouridine synthase [Deltaproteobacteria bacterium]
MSPGRAVARKFRAGPLDAGVTLGAWLASRMGVLLGDVESMVARGSVYLDGKRVPPGGVVRPLVGGERVTVYAAAPPREDVEPFHVVFQDRDVLVACKPSGLPSQAAREGGPSLDGLVRALEKGARLMHRLDRDASGLVLFALSPSATVKIQRALEQGTLKREYLAVVSGNPANERFTLDAPIGRDPTDHRRYKARVSGGKNAITHVSVVRKGMAPTGAPVSLVMASLVTGRTHQIRVHLADAGYPLLGDRLYAPPLVVALAPRLALHATRLAWPGGEARSELPLELAALVG